MFSKSALVRDAKLVSRGKNLPKASQIVGTYKDDWFGNVIISYNGKAYTIKSERSSQLVGELLPYDQTTYIAKWNNRSFDADVFVNFVFDENETLYVVILSKLVLPSLIKEPKLM